MGRIIADKASGGGTIEAKLFSIPLIPKIDQISSMIIEKDLTTYFVYKEGSEVKIAFVNFFALTVKTTSVTKILGSDILGASVTSSKHYFVTNSISLTTNIMETQNINTVKHALIYSTLKTTSTTTCYPDLSSQ